MTKGNTQGVPDSKHDVADTGGDRKVPDPKNLPEGTKPPEVKKS